MQLYINSLSGGTYQFDMESMDTILSVKEKYYDFSGIPIDQQRLIYQGKELDDDSATLASYEIVKESKIHCLLRLGGPPRNVLWKPFIKTMNIQPMESDIDVNIKIRIVFQPHKNKEINFKGLLESKDTNGEIHKMQNAWENYLVKTHTPEKVQSFFWCKRNFSTRIMVVKLREEFVEKGDNMLEYIEQEKYNIFGINRTYYGGDSRSWQRYTKELPIDGKIEGAQQLGFEQFLLVKYSFSKELEEDTWYALLLLHNNQYYDDAIYEDLVVPFKTKTSPPNLVFKMIDYE
jgi:hypothetical protein